MTRRKPIHGGSAAASLRQRVMKQALHPPSGILLKGMLRHSIHAVEGSNCPSTPPIPSSYDKPINGGFAAASLRQRVMKQALHPPSDILLKRMLRHSIYAVEGFNCPSTPPIPSSYDIPINGAPLPHPCGRGS